MTGGQWPTRKFRPAPRPPADPAPAASDTPADQKRAARKPDIAALYDRLSGLVDACAEACDAAGAVYEELKSREKHTQGLRDMLRNLDEAQESVKEAMENIYRYRAAQEAMA